MSEWPFGEYPPGGLERIGPHVTAYYADGLHVSNSAIVRGAEATLVFDANILRCARTLREAAGEPPPAYLVLSHVHNDHTFGSAHFSPPAQVLAREYTRSKLASRVDDDPVERAAEYAWMYPGAEEEARVVPIVVPDRTLEEESSLDLGGVMVRLVPEAVAHTKGDLWAFVEPDGVALCGDLWFTGCEPYLGSGSVEGAVAAIDRLRDANANVYLPGHGRAGTVAPQGSEPVQRFCAWLLDETAAGIGRGLDGNELRSAVRAAYGSVQEDVGFSFSIPGFLEAGVEAAARDVRGSRG